MKTVLEGSQQRDIERSLEEGEGSDLEAPPILTLGYSPLQGSSLTSCGLTI